VNWTAGSRRRVAVIGVANTFDLPERVFQQKVNSRFNLHRLMFEAYTHEQVS
jgi:Cdc6-like AAA superfamily ATPase